MTRKILATLFLAAFAFAVQADDSGSDEKKCDSARCAKKKAMMAKYDADGDGELSETERKAAHEARRAEVLAKFDADGDGELNEAERKAARAEMGPRQGGKGHGRHGKGPGRGGKGPGHGHGDKPEA